ncbi:hypothetical protein BX666DRAFT_2024839 [Dichotomocladium elegans]|nr:hypothetical protein BX666DRAFT_2024839 [Dichotomocladium elegans]
MSFDIPETMQALQVVQTGPAEDALRYNQVKTPKITKPNQLLINVKAVGVNPVEAKIRSGVVSPVNWVLRLPSIFGSDYAGVVVAKGDNVNDFEVGDEVVVTEGKDAIAKKPNHLSFEEAAGVGIAMMTAYQGIVLQGGLDIENKDNKILVIGASGGVGSFAVQIAKNAIGAQVVAICSGRNKDLVLSLGADRVVDYTQPEELDALITDDEKETFDLILDCVGGDDYYNKLSPVLKPNSVYVTAVGPIEHFGATPLGLLDIVKLGGRLVHRKCFASHSYSIIAGLAWNRFAAEVSPLLADRKVKTVLPEDQIYDLKDGSKAHLQLESHRTVGKIVLRVS